MSDQDAWQLAHDAAVAYEKDFVPAIFAQWPPVLAEVAGMKPGDRVLDVACGTGILARDAADRVGSTGRVTGFDLNEAMLAVARRLRAEINWRQGDAGKLPFEDGAFDVVVSQFALMFFPDQVAALREMWRVLRCSEKFLGRDMSRFTNAYGLIDVGKAGCASTQFLATFDEIKDASMQPEPSTFDSKAFWKAFLNSIPMAVGVFLLVNALGLLYLAVRGVGRWVLAGFRNS